MTTVSMRRAATRKRSTGGRRGARLSDIAEMAGVSAATVSRALNTPDLVRPSTMARIKSVVDRTGYIPDGAARALASRRSKTLGLLVPDISSNISGQTIEAFQLAAESAGYAVLLASSNFDEKTRTHVEMMLERRVDALLIVTTRPDEGLYASLDKRGIPFVITAPNVRRYGPAFVGYDHVAAAERVTSFLIELGHTEIGVVASTINRSTRLKQRIDIFRKTLARHRLRFNPNWLVEMRTSDLASGREALRTLQSRGSLPTAIMASDDPLAAGVVFEALKQGHSVPGDLSVAGYGDMDVAAQMQPALTTLRTPKAEIGRRAADYLIKRLLGEAGDRRQLLPFELVVRDTTGKPGR